MEKNANTIDITSMITEKSVTNLVKSAKGQSLEDATSALLLGSVKILKSLEGCEFTEDTLDLTVEVLDLVVDQLRNDEEVRKEICSAMNSAGPVVAEMINSAISQATTPTTIGEEKPRKRRTKVDESQLSPIDALKHQRKCLLTKLSIARKKGKSTKGLTRKCNNLKKKIEEMQKAASSSTVETPAEA